MKNLKYILIALIFLVAGFLIGQSYQFKSAENQSPSSGTNEQNSQPVTVVFKFDDTNIIEIQNVAIVNNQSVLDLTKKVAEENQLSFKTQDYGELGLLVTQIGEKENTQENKYWQFYLNDKFSNIGAGEVRLSGGERIEWVFQKSEY